MTEIKTKDYTAKPSDNKKWVIIESPAGTSIDVELHVLNYHYDCVPKMVPFNNTQIPCSYLCCYCGCYVAQKEIDIVTKMLGGVKPLLQEDGKKVLEETGDQFHCPYDYDETEKLYKIRAAPCEWPSDHNPNHDSEAKKTDSKQTSDPSLSSAPQPTPEPEIPDDILTEPRPHNHCVFLQENGYCAIHSYCLENKQNWVKDKFNICVTFPLDIRPQDKTLAFMNQFDTFTYAKVDCICDDEEKKIKLGMPQIIESMKYAIVDRYGDEWWNALNRFAIDYRAGKIDMKKIYNEGTKTKTSKQAK